MKFTRIAVGIVSTISILTMLAAGYTQFTNFAVSNMKFEFSSYAVVYAVVALIMAGFLILLRIKESQNRVTFWLSVTIFFDILFMISGLLSATSGNVATYSFWYHLLAFTTPMAITAFFFFILTVTGHEKYVFRFFTWIPVMLSAMFIYYVDVTTPFFNDTMTAVRTRWGYPPFALGGRYTYSIYETWLEAFLVIGTILLIRHYIKNRSNPRKGRQALLIATGSISTIFFSTVPIVVIPKLFHVTLPPMLPFAMLTNFAIISYAILKYKVFTIEPAALSEIVLATMNESVLTVNTYNEVEHMNPAAKKLLGLKSDQDISGQSLGKIFSGETLKIIEEKIKSSESDPIELDLEVGEKTVPISLLSSNIEAGGAILVFRDITKERAVKGEIEQQVISRTVELHEEQAKLRASIESFPIGFMLADKKGNSIIQNKALSGLLGLDSEAGSIAKIKTTLSKYDIVETFEKILANGRPINISGVNSGSKILRLFMAPVRVKNGYDESVIGVVTLLEDITEAKILERSKDEFFSIASHELRTPLTSIKGNSSMILQYFADTIKDKDLKEMLGDIHESSVRLISIVNDFLDLSRLEQGKVSFTYEAFDLEPVVDEVVFEMKSILKEKNLTLRANNLSKKDLPQVWADKNRTKQVIYNLIGNAAKFTDNGGVSVEAKLEGNNIKVLIIDTGRGLSLGNQELLFRKFQQANTSLLTRDSSRGTGLGLYISKMIIESMGGNIALEHSEEGKGSTFSFTLSVASDTVSAKNSEKLPATYTDSVTGLSVSAAHKQAPVK
ncbi:MAG: Na+/proline symporter [Candidatus Saccharibacteria bacterium]|nr:Na+/proline symporter [Candidatus Saccharibacteria bacterium]